MVNIRRSLALSFAQRNSTLVIQFVSSLFIARLLTPHEIGIFSIGAVVVSFSHILRDMGVSNYLIQERELTTDRIRAAQAIIWITSWTLALALILLSYGAGKFYAEPGVTLTMQVLAINFLLLPIGNVTVALLTREMEFGRLFVINFSSALIQALSGILLAWMGFGFISLAWSAVAGASVAALGSIMCRRPGQPWLPGIKEWRRVFAAGTKLSGTSMLCELGLGGPELIAGRLLGFEAVAYFSRGFGAAMMIYRALVDSLMPVATPYFASLSRAEQNMKTSYMHGMACISVLALPAFACVGVMAEPIIIFLYGRSWLDAVLPLQISCAGLACSAVTTVASSVLVGSGELGKNIFLHAIFQPSKLLLVAIGASFFGLAGLAAGVAIGDIGFTICCLFISNRLVGVSPWECCACLLPSAGIALGVSLVAWLTLHALDPFASLVLQGSLAVLGSGLCWLIGLVLTHHPLWHELQRVLRKQN